MATLLAVVLATLLSALALVHFYWAFGGRAGLELAVPSDGGRPVLSPGPLACTVVGMLLAIGALLALWRGGIIALPLAGWLPRVGTWVLAAVFFLRAVGDRRYVGFLKQVRDTDFARLDSRFFSPLCLLLALLAASLSLLT